jgi:Fe2+ or Zn2+ uptake regulation protein
MTSDHQNQRSNPDGPDPKEILSTNGIRITSQRRALLQVLLEADDHHDHIVDLETGEVVEFQSEDIEKLQMAIARNLGYDLIHHRLELYCLKMRL